MGFVIVIILGAVTGWLASIVMRTDAQRGIFLNILLGMLGALLAGLLFAGPAIGRSISVSALLVSFVGALALVAGAKLFRRGTVR